MKRLFDRFRATRGKPATVTRTVTLRSLDKAWAASVRRLALGCPSVRWQRKSTSYHATWIANAASRIVKKDARAAATSHDPTLSSGNGSSKRLPISGVERGVIGRATKET
ncbi:hypothetical protein GQ600_18444 [Phytophthora cactorum]|nr:hypothetical protein GQ600_18444 [Phytophthora cactorum]